MTGAAASPRVRRAAARDADALGTVVAASWRATYAGLMPPGLLAAQHAAARAARYRALLEDEGERRFWIAEDAAGGPLGLAGTCRSRDDDAGPATSELAALYVLPAWIGRGLGRALQERALADLAARAFDEAVVWVLAANERARRFYERTGWTLDRDGVTKELQGFPLVVARYRRRLARPAPLAGPDPGRRPGGCDRPARPA